MNEGRSCSLSHKVTKAILTSPPFWLVLSVGFSLAVAVIAFHSGVA